MPPTTTTKRMPLEIERLPVRFDNDDGRVIARLFTPGGEMRIRKVIQRIAKLGENDIDRLIAKVMHQFRHRHANIEEVFREHYETVVRMVGRPIGLSENRKLLIGSYFTMEYSFESAALFNPSIVPNPDQCSIDPNSIRFLMSLRATGEGHISSLVFRTGTITANGVVEVDPPSAVSHAAKVSHDREYHREVFRRKLHEMSVDQDTVDTVMNALDESFTFSQLEQAVSAARSIDPNIGQHQESIDSMFWLARSNYELKLHRGSDASELVIFPQSENDSRGIEDLRLVRFEEDDGETTYMGTYTAFNGYTALPQMMETSKFNKLRIHTLNGACAVNKGMALFPRKIDGHYVMCSRIDGENLFISYSDMLHFWESAEPLTTPRAAWELMQIGNCGSPIETEAGWIMLTHGVGPMRQYCIGAMLLDLDDPTKIIGQLEQPLISPTECERDGYVPNVVYTCGAMEHNGRLIIPYAASDQFTSFGSVEIDTLLDWLIN